MPAAQIEFLKDDGRRYRALLQRPDGVSVAFDGGAYNRVGGQAGELPHNIADPDPAAVRRAVGERWSTDRVTRLSLERAHVRLRDAAEQWADLIPGEALTASWRLPPR